jgi:hypothetical protein
MGTNTKDWTMLRLIAAAALALATTTPAMAQSYGFDRNGNMHYMPRADLPKSYGERLVEDTMRSQRTTTCTTYGNQTTCTGY